jgi:deazaflavin-dependent oxidoreductase (nitroreductase family)
LIVVASNTGEDAHPAWWLNLMANPAVEVLVGTKRSRVRATEVEEPERTRLYRRFIDEVDRAYAEYVERTTRRIPVVALTPQP